MVDTWDTRSHAFLLYSNACTYYDARGRQEPEGLCLVEYTIGPDTHGLASTVVLDRSVCDASYVELLASQS